MDRSLTEPAPQMPLALDYVAADPDLMQLPAG
jgi:hypothetical protein